MKVLAAVAAAALVALAVGIIGLVSLGGASDSAQLIYTSNVSGVKMVGQLRVVVAQARVDTANQALSVDDALSQKFADSFTQDLADFTTAIAAYRANDPASSTAVIDELQTNWDAYAEVATNKLIPLGERNELKQWSEIRDAEALPPLAKISTALTTMDQAEVDDAAKNAEAAKAGYESSRSMSIITLVIGLALALAMGFVVARKIVQSLTKVTYVCDGLADGDLTRTTGLSTTDEPGRMGRSLDRAMERLRTTMATIEGAAASLAGASEQMTGTTAQIAASAEQTSVQAQAVSAAAEEVSRSVDTVSAGSEQMGASIREISQNAAEAARVAAEAVSVTASTSATMGKL
ncbi:MAG: methyl-accepting chemotaxis protein, partial [Actinoplanes sp.]